MIDQESLHQLAARAIPRALILAGNWRSVVASSDLHHVGYTIRHWLRLSDGAEIVEYLPRLSALPRLTASCYREQAAIHLALGLNLVGPGEPWVDYGQAGLFDAFWSTTDDTGPDRDAEAGAADARAAAGAISARAAVMICARASDWKPASTMRCAGSSTGRRVSLTGWRMIAKLSSRAIIAITVNLVAEGLDDETERTV